jgi:type I restriction enzyme, S subunit
MPTKGGVLMAFPLRPFSDLVEINPSMRLKKGVEYPFLPMEEIICGCRYVKATASRAARGGAKFCHGDTLFARITPCLQNGKIAQFISKSGDVAFGSTEYWVFRARKEVADPSFIFYLARSDIIRKPAEKSMVGASGRQRAVVESIADLDVPTPSLVVQRQAASILSAYDDLIENNTRRIAILDEMAWRIYEEWFIHFRFPGHEKINMVESELGQIPRGWRTENVGKLLEHHIGGGWGEEHESNEFSIAAFVIRGTDIPDVRQGSLGRSPLRFHKDSNFRNRKLQPDDIVFEVSGGSKDQPVGRSVIARSRLFSKSGHPLICASFCKLVRVNRTKILPDLLDLHFKRIYDNREILKYQTQSTGITNFKFTVFLEKEVVVIPPTELQNDFAERVVPLLNFVDLLGAKNANLRTTRDLLLPKLISGELDVSEIELPRRDALAA